MAVNALAAAETFTLETSCTCRCLPQCDRANSHWLWTCNWDYLCSKSHGLHFKNQLFGTVPLSFQYLLVQAYLLFLWRSVKGFAPDEGLKLQVSATKWQFVILIVICNTCLKARA